MNKKMGFTLAEVLIVIGIIGIIAQATIPTLVNNVQTQVTTTQFKKAYSTLNNAVLLMKSNSGYLPNCYYGLNGYNTDMSECIDFFNQFKSVLTVTKYCSNNAYSNGCIPRYNGVDTSDPNMTQADKDYAIANCGGFSQSDILNNGPAYILADGTIIFQYGSTVPLFGIDVNGQKKPNKWGFDTFSFLIGNDGKALKMVDGGCQPYEGGKSTGQMIIDSFK